MTPSPVCVCACVCSFHNTHSSVSGGGVTLLGQIKNSKQRGESGGDSQSDHRQETRTHLALRPAEPAEPAVPEDQQIRVLLQSADW